MTLGELYKKCNQLLGISTFKKSSDFGAVICKLKRDGESKEDLYGSMGSFTRVSNDFTVEQLDADNLTHANHFEQRNGSESFYCDKQVKKPKEKFRFVMAALALSVVAISLMARILLNVSIVEMTRSTRLDQTTDSTNDVSLDLVTTTIDFYDDTTNSTSTEFVTSSDEEIISEYEEELDWSAGAQNLLLASFYFGYPPAIMLSGGLSDLYGSKVPLLICGLGSALVSLLTPFAARYSLTLLICLRAALGAFQGALIPACYDLFNRWLTITETSIFVPLIKVSFAFGTFLGALLPGLILHLGFEWPYFFYVSSIICGIWCVVWIPLATSTPQTNSFVSKEELEWIMRKKKHEKHVKEQYEMNELKQNQINTLSGGKSDTLIANQSRMIVNQNHNSNKSLKKPSSTSTPWIKIIFNPSVLALSLVKFTYNVGMDFVTLELATYLRQVHNAPMETISAIASGGCLMQMFLVTFVAWIAKVVIHNETLGLTKTKWRKIFQGSSNFILAFVYLALSVTGQRLWLATCLFLVVFFAWMLGAGGEAMVPYDLSAKYPATIVGIAQSIASLAGLMVPSVCGFVLGEDMSNLNRWNYLFQLISAALGIGGLVFVFVLKAKPFLPDEREPPKNKTTD